MRGVPKRGSIKGLYLLLGEGYGTAYERYAFDRFAEELLRRYEISTVLELPADGIMGIPGLNSLIFAELGCAVTVAHPSKRLLLNAKRLWTTLGLRANFVTTHHLRSGFKDDAFDLVRNFCVLVHVEDVRSMIKEMLRVTRRYVLLEVQNVRNIGLPLHRLYHALRKEPWTHGDMENARLSYIRWLIEQEGGRILETGTMDMPPWPDIDVRLRRTQRSRATSEQADTTVSEIGPKVEPKPVAEIISKLQDISATSTFAERLFGIWYELVESKMPSPLKVAFAHHSYLIAEKCQ